MQILTVNVAAHFPDDLTSIDGAFHRDSLLAIQQVKDALRQHYADRCHEAAATLLTGSAPLTARDKWRIELATDFAATCSRRIGGRKKPSIEEKRRQTLARVRRFRERAKAAGAAPSPSPPLPPGVASRITTEEIAASKALEEAEAAARRQAAREAKAEADVAADIADAIEADLAAAVEGEVEAAVEGEIEGGVEVH